MRLKLDSWTWRPGYLINAVASLYCPILVIWLVPNDKPHTRSKRMDWVGSFLLGSSLFALLFGMTAAQTARRGWRAPRESFDPASPTCWADQPVDVPVLLILFVVLFVLFVLRQRQLLRAAENGQNRTPPLIPASLLTKQCWNLLVIYLASFSCWAGVDVSDPLFLAPHKLTEYDSPSSPGSPTSISMCWE